MTQARQNPRWWVGAAIICRAGVGWWLGFRPFDDTYITIRFAKNLIDGGGFTYNAGDPVLAITTPIWALLIAAGGMFGFSLESVALVLGLAADAGVVWLLWSLVRSLGLGNHAALFGVAFFVALTDAWSLARSGMEVGAFALCALGAIRLAVGNRLVAAWGLAAISVLVRPEGILVFVVLVSLAWVSRPRRHTPWQAVALAAGLGAVWGIGAWWYFGSPIPQSLIAKASHVAADPGLCGFSTTNLRLLVTTGQFGDLIFTRSWLQMAWLPWLCGAIGAVSLRRSVSALVGLAALPLLYGALYGSRCAFSWFPWYYYAFYPFVCALAGIGMARLWQRSRALALAVVVAWVGAQTLAFVTQKLPASESFLLTAYAQAAAPIPRSPEVVVAATEIGVIGWRVYPARILDLVGLASPQVLSAPQTESIARTRPDALILRTDEGAPLIHALRATDWFARDYAEVSTINDPGSDTQFITWRRR